MDILKGLYKEFHWFIWGLVGLGFLWFLAGGAQRAAAPYIKPAAPLSTGETYGTPYTASTKASQTQQLDLPTAPAEAVKEAESAIADFLTLSKDAQRIHDSVLLSKTLLLDGVAGAKSSDPQTEYLRIVAPQNSVGTTSLAGFSLFGGGNNIKIALPKAANLPILGTPYEESDIIVPPDGRAIISSGRSPIGTSFRVNICSGYLGQSQQFTPALRQDCPTPAAELARVGLADNASCSAFVSAIPRCQAYSGALPDSLSTSCKIFVTSELNYNGCVSVHKDDAGFFKDEWRLFLGQTTELWKNSQEIIRLLDAKGATIDAITY